MGPQSTGSTGQPNMLSTGCLLPLTSQMCHILNGIINPLVFARKVQTSFKAQAPSGNVLIPEGSRFSYLSRGLAVFGTCHVKTRSGASPLFTFAPGALTPCLLSLRMEIDKRPEFRTGKALLAVRVVTAGGGNRRCKNHTHILSSASLIRSGLGRDCGRSAAFNGRQLWRTKGKDRKKSKALLTRGLGARRTYFLCSLCHHSHGYLRVAQSARLSACVCLCECGVRPGTVVVGRRILVAEARRGEPGQKSRVFLLCAADGCGSETERRRGAE